MIRIRSARQLGKTLRALRTGQGWTQAALGARLNVKDKTIYDRERGHLGIHTDALVQTAGVFGFDVVLVPRPDPALTLPRGWRRTGTGWPA